MVKARIEQEPRLIPPLALAYIGDAVYELRVREYFLQHGSQKVDHLHRQAVSKVRAEEQARLALLIEDQLTEAEVDIFKRGRNAKSGHQPPNVSVGDYRRATGLESLVGYWYLMDDQKRLDWVFSLLLNEKGAE